MQSDRDYKYAHKYDVEDIYTGEESYIYSNADYKVGEIIHTRFKVKEVIY